MARSNLIAYTQRDQQDGGQRDQREKSTRLSILQQNDYGGGEEQKQRQRQLDSEAH